jgi:SAM-dependent methyltransferase
MLHWLRNEIDFRIRSTLRLRRPGPKLPHEPKDELFDSETTEEVERLVTTYDLHLWQQQSGRTDFAASLFYLQMLERALNEANITLPDPISALDAGCGDWFYVQALYGLLRRHGGGAPRSVALDGVELDAYQPYAGFRARLDWAEAFMAGLDGVCYIPGDIRRYDRQVDIAFMLFPFLFPQDVRRWGLPRRYLEPAELLGHVYSLLKPGGWLVIANLGEAERDARDRLLAAAGLRPVWAGRHVSPLFAYRQDRYLCVITKA